ncbi:MAG: hypothetical protein HYV33_04860 [Candidatus Kerfeldbacteria bacterium]|nr:hypothetical protein [Candidatus Kerfeldbacteria bacterium]
MNNTIHSRAEWDTLTNDQLPFFLFTEQVKATMPIQDCGEPLVHLQPFFAQRQSHIRCTAGLADYGARTTDMYLRPGAANRLLQAEQKLAELSNHTLSLQLTDSYRPISLQRQYFNDVKQKLAATGVHGQKLYRQITRVIADPDTCPPHSTGGVVDLTIYAIASEQPIDMGTAIDDIDNELIDTFHPNVPPLVRQHRQLLFTVMITAGFVNTAAEWWHYSYGDQEWALRTRQPQALYGSVLEI